MSEKHDDQSGPDPRLPYQPPAVITEEVFETLALSCAKANQILCPGGEPMRS